MEKTLVIIKPDAFGRSLCGKILSFYEEDGLALSAARVLKPGRELLKAHYAAHTDKPFFDPLLAFMSEGPVLALVLERRDAVGRVRRLNGATDPAQAEAGTLRALYGTDIQHNAVHGSETPGEARREIALWFS